MRNPPTIIERHTAAGRTRSHRGGRLCRTPRSVREFFKYFLVLTDVLNNVGTMCVSENERASGATMTTILMDQLNTGDVIEMKTNDNDVITVLV